MNVVDFYSTECLVDGTHMDGTVIDNALGGGDALVSYMSAMRTFAQCIDANIEVPGYCHGSLTDAKGKYRLYGSHCCLSSQLQQLRHGRGSPICSSCKPPGLLSRRHPQHWLPHPNSVQRPRPGASRQSQMLSVSP